MTATATTQGVHHVGLTVPDIAETRRFFVEQLGFAEVGGRPAYPAVFVSDGAVMLTLWQVADPARARAFDRKHGIGLHHLALRVADARALHAVAERLSQAPGVELEFAPEPLGETGLSHLMCTIPGGIRLELVARAA